MRIAAAGIAVAGLLVAVPVAAEAQEGGTQELPVQGETIRVSTSDGAGPVEGGYWGIADGELLLFREGRTLHFPLEEVELVEVETPPARGRTTAIGAVLGLLTGAALVAGLTDSDALGRHHLVVPALGVVGGVIGYRVGGPGWRPVPLHALVEAAHP